MTPVIQGVTNLEMSHHLSLYAASHQKLELHVIIEHKTDAVQPETGRRAEPKNEDLLCSFFSKDGCTES